MALIGYFTAILWGIITALSVGASADICADMANGLKYQDPSDCHGFFVCLKGKSYQAYCDYGEKFDKVSQKCVIGKCPPCENCDTTSGSSTQQPPSSPTTISTPTTPWTRPTTPPSTPTTSAKPNTCNGHPNGSIYPDWFDCSKFYFCVHGREISAICEPGTYFDKNLNACNDKDEVECTSIVTDKSTPTTTTSTASTPSEPLDPYSCEHRPDGYIFRDPHDCGKFYYCVGGNKVERHCENGDYFDTNMNLCRDSDEVDCVSDITPDPTTTTSTTTEKPTTTTPTTTSTTTEEPTTTSSTTTSTTTEEPTTTPSTTTSTTTETPTTTSTTTISTPTTTLSTSSTTPRNGQVDPNVRDCNGRPNGSFVRDRNHCRIYYVCRNDEAVKHSCPVSQWFDDRHFVCNTRTFVSCAAGID